MPPEDVLRVLDPYNAEWVTFLLLALVAALAWTNMSSPRKWRLLMHAMFRMRLGRQTLREEIDVRDRTFVGLLLVAVAVLSLFVWQSLGLLTGVGWASYPVLLAATAGVLVVQAMLPSVVGGLFRVDRGLSEHQATGLLLFILTGMLLLPIVLLLAYRSAWRVDLMWAGAVVVGLLILYRWVRAVWIGMGESVPLRYIILYLCAAEVAPILLLLVALRRSITLLSHT
jgi:hypothetical protein